MLDEAKILSDDINAKQKIAEETQEKINETRAGCVYFFKMNI